MTGNSLPTITLGICLGTGLCGVAVLSGSKLIEWHTHRFPGAWSEDKVRHIVERLFEYAFRNRPESVVIKLQPVSHRTANVLYLLDRFTERLDRSEFAWCVCTKEELKREVPEITNKVTLLGYVHNLHPILEVPYKSEMKARDNYHLHMFDAVLAAMVMRPRP